jgi:phosphate-selective porin
MKARRRPLLLSSPLLLATLLAPAAARAQAAEPKDDRSTAPEPVPAPPAAEPVAAPAPPAPPPPPTNLGSPRAYLDYSDGTFFLRSADDNLIINTGGRVHVDTYAFAGPNVGNYHKSNGSELAPYMFFRRFVIESGGLVRKHWFFWIGGNFAPTQIDQNQNTTSTAAVYDGFMGWQAEPWLQLYAGQNNTPITMENVTSSRWIDFMERALVVRTIAAPYNKDLGLTFWGATKDGVAPFEWQLGVYGGDGMNRPNVDTRFDGMARAVLRPLAAQKGALQRLHVGASGRYGSRDDQAINYDAPTMSTPGGYAYWSPTYTAQDKTEVHIIPSGDQAVIAGEVYVPFERFDVKGELVYAYEQRREAAANARNVTLRQGLLDGWGGYLQLSYWPIGNVRVNGHPAGRYFGIRPPKDRGTEAPYGLQLLARAETVHMKYDGNGRSPEVPDAGISTNTNRIRVDALQLAANYWATKHVRLTAEYSLYSFPGSPASTGAGASNQAAAPGAKASPSDPAANILHEVGFRVGLAL